MILEVTVDAGTEDEEVSAEDDEPEGESSGTEAVVVDTAVPGVYEITYTVAVDTEAYISYLAEDSESDSDIVYTAAESVEYIEILRTVTVVDTETADTLCENGDTVWASGNEIYEKTEEEDAEEPEETGDSEETDTASAASASEEPTASVPEETATSQDTEESSEASVPEAAAADTVGSVVDTYPFAESTTQVIDVVSSGSTGTLTLYNKDNGVWTAVLSTSCYVGYNGISSSKVEGDKKTPAGYFTLGQAFGVSANPGSTRSYLQVNANHYWVDDSNSPYYNQLVDSSVTGIQWSSADHLIDSPTAYKYAIAINYNTACTPGAGSAIFLHCQIGKPTVGCVSVGESYMIQILQSLRGDTIIYIH
ncbi:MAG: L,D-transpeptidase family protein [Clostridiales bacterium]|nr:L,D-transpeptidase family protein [Clostridiales bacterium]